MTVDMVMDMMVVTVREMDMMMVIEMDNWT